MAVEIKSLTLGTPVLDTSNPAVLDTFNVIPAASPGSVYDLYTAPSAAIVRTIRLVNTHSGPVKVTLYFTRPTAPTNGNHRRRLLTPLDMELTANFVYIDNHEITMDVGDKIQGKADVPNVIQYLISGVEREAV